MQIAELEDWLARQCNGDWEHQGGISIESTDNPGWYIEICLDGNKVLPEIDFEKESVFKSDQNYLTIKRRKADTISIACGLSNLTDAIRFIVTKL